MPNASFQLNGQEVFSEASGVVTLKSATLDSSVTFPITAASYKWDVFNPSDLSGTITNAGTGTAVDNAYVSMSNSSGTLTINFDIAGRYFISTSIWSNPSAGFAYDTAYLQMGGTATRHRSEISQLSNYSTASQNGNMATNWSFLATATVNQTVTLLPKYRVSGTSGTTANFQVYFHTDILYCGGA